MEKPVCAVLAALAGSLTPLRPVFLCLSVSFSLCGWLWSAVLAVSAFLCPLTSVLCVLLPLSPVASGCWPVCALWLSGGLWGACVCSAQWFRKASEQLRIICTLCVVFEPGGACHARPSARVSSTGLETQGPETSLLLLQRNLVLRAAPLRSSP